MISDGDFAGQSYATGRLAPREAGHRDLLTIIKLKDGKAQSAEIPVSNSVTAAPEILALTHDGRTAFVTERQKDRGEKGEAVKDLAPGDRLFAVDVADPKRLRIADTVSIAASPEALAVSPDGERVAVVSNTSDASFLQIVDYEDGRFGEVARFNLADIGLKGSGSGPRGGVTATNVQWHPSGRFLAVNVNTQNRVAFFQVGDTPRLWGNVVEVGKDPFVGRFTPDDATTSHPTGDAISRPPAWKDACRRSLHRSASSVWPSRTKRETRRGILASPPRSPICRPKASPSARTDG